MRSSILAALIGAVALTTALPGEDVLPRAQCNRDNCFRAVTKHASDCATATTVPAYASACTGSVRYSSACSCITSGAGSTTTTTSATTTTTGTPAVSPTAIYLQVGSGSAFEAFNEPVIPVLSGSQYMVQADDTDYTPFYFTPVAGATDNAGLLSPANPANGQYYSSGVGGGTLFAYQGALPQIYCSLDGGNNSPQGQFTCSSGTTSTQFYQDCQGYIALGMPTSDECPANSITAIDLIYEIATGSE